MGLLGQEVGRYRRVRPVARALRLRSASWSGARIAADHTGGRLVLKSDLGGM